MRILAERMEEVHNGELGSELTILNLYHRNVKNHTACHQVPGVCKSIDEILLHTPLCRYGQVKVSLLPPGTHVKPTCGLTNLRIRLNLGLNIPNKPSYQIRVANETRTWQQGKVLILDDSFEHELFSPDLQKSQQQKRMRVGETRIVLVVDIWHPNMRKDEMHVEFEKLPLQRW
eukprot:CAMPEP_0185797804 /NCGR_PEP_ID=MMETSP1174-20130828/161812_1 /TAXON_ID=35687 /ORGANISM="Dictyocha speculum, Strain CCMP1381" /LENGTH=173 /DNA_ID=CAMNT_0028493263 /DNA_START=545 /DNA_END=1066 /DNA_ORIENTATION=-